MRRKDMKSKHGTQTFWKIRNANSNVGFAITASFHSHPPPTGQDLSSQKSAVFSVQISATSIKSCPCNSLIFNSSKLTDVKRKSVLNIGPLLWEFLRGFSSKRGPQGGNDVTFSLATQIVISGLVFLLFDHFKNRSQLSRYIYIVLVTCTHVSPTGLVHRSVHGLGEKHQERILRKKLWISVFSGSC